MGGRGGGGCSWPGEARRALLLALALGSLLAQPCRASFFSFGVRTAYTVQLPRDTGGGHREEKVPMTVVVSDYSPRPAPLAAAAGAPSPAPALLSAAGAPATAPAPVHGAGAGTDAGMPRLPSERRVPRAPTGAVAGAPAGATSTDFISSSPAVPLPAGVTDSATVLPMPTPGQQHRRDDVGMGARQLQAPAVQLAVPLLMMLSLVALW